MKKKFGFHIVKEKKDPTEEIADDIIDELQDSQNPMREMELKIKAHRYRFFRRVVIVAVSVVVVTAGVGLFLKYQTYENVAVTATYENEEADNSNYREYAGSDCGSVQRNGSCWGSKWDKHFGVSKRWTKRRD